MVRPFLRLSCAWGCAGRCCWTLTQIPLKLSTASTLKAPKLHKVLMKAQVKKKAQATKALCLVMPLTKHLNSCLHPFIMHTFLFKQWQTCVMQVKNDLDLTLKAK